MNRAWLTPTQKPSAAHATRIKHPLVDRIANALSTDVVSRQDPFEFGDHVPAAFKPDPSQVSPIADTEIVEWREEAAVQRFPESHLIGDAIVKPMEDVFCVGTLRCCG